MNRKAEPIATGAEVLLIAGVLMFAGGTGGYLVRDYLAVREANKDVQINLDNVQAARTVERRGVDAAVDTGKVVAAESAQIRVQTKEVIRYVQNIPPDIAALTLPDEFVRPVNAAITGNVSGLTAGAGQPDKPTAEVRTDDAALTLSENFATCREALSRAEAWPKFYDEVRATYNQGKQ